MASVGYHMFVLVLIQFSLVLHTSPLDKSQQYIAHFIKVTTLKKSQNNICFSLQQVHQTALFLFSKQHIYSMNFISTNKESQTKKMSKQKPHPSNTASALLYLTRMRLRSFHNHVMPSTQTWQMWHFQAQ